MNFCERLRRGGEHINPLKYTFNMRLEANDRRVWQLAWPIIVSNLSVPLVGMVDAAVVGHLGVAAYIGAIALGAMLFSLLYWSFGFLRMGTTGLIAQAAGANDGSLIRLHLSRHVITAIVLGCLIVLLRKPVLELALTVIGGSEQVEALTADYFQIRIFSAPAVLVQYVILGVLIGLGRTRAVLLIQLVLNLGNVILDVIFVVVFELGVAGVATASLIAEVTSTLFAAYICLRIVARIPGAWRFDQLTQTRPWKRMFEVNANLFIRTLAVISVNSVFTVIGTRMGDTVLAANYTLMSMVHVLAHGLDGYAHAAEILTGTAYGRKNRLEFDEAVRSSTRLATVTAIGFCVCWLVLGVFLINAMTNHGDVREIAYHHLPWVVVTPLVAVWSFQLDGIFIGTTHTREMRDSMLISVAAFALAAIVFTPIFGNHGLWATMMVFYVVRAYTLFRRLGSIHAVFTGPP